MTRLSIEDARQISASQGWLTLRNLTDAAAHLDQVTPAGRECLEYLSVLWEVQNKTKQWVAAVNTADKIQKLAPDHHSGYIWRSISLEKLGCTEDAYENLEPVAYKFTYTGIVAYMLAVFACELRRMDYAKAWLQCAFAAPEGKELKLRALEEKALEPFWEQIGNL